MYGVVKSVKLIAKHFSLMSSISTRTLSHYRVNVLFRSNKNFFFLSSKLKIISRDMSYIITFACYFRAQRLVIIYMLTKNNCCENIVIIQSEMPHSVDKVEFQCFMRGNFFHFFCHPNVMCKYGFIVDVL